LNLTVGDCITSVIYKSHGKHVSSKLPYIHYAPQHATSLSPSATQASHPILRVPIANYHPLPFDGPWYCRPCISPHPISQAASTVMPWRHGRGGHPGYNELTCSSYPDGAFAGHAGRAYRFRFELGGPILAIRNALLRGGISTICNHGLCC
jgi:hypothetical protein